MSFMTYSSCCNVLWLKLRDFSCKMFYVLAGETLFNVNYLTEPPDFIFGDNDQQFLPDIEQVKVVLEL